jgi:hypothetical protein
MAPPLNILSQAQAGAASTTDGTPTTHPHQDVAARQRNEQSSSSGAAAFAPDGQHIVDERVDSAQEHAEIQKAANRLEKLSQVEREGTPSVRFWDSRRAQMGPLMVLFAGLFTLAVRTWPIAVPQGRGSLGVGWFVGATIVGVLYLAGFFLADRQWRWAKLIVMVAAVAHLVIAFTSGTLVDAQNLAPARVALFFDLVPALVALIAAFLIKPAPGSSSD